MLAFCVLAPESMSAAEPCCRLKALLDFDEGEPPKSSKEKPMEDVAAILERDEGKLCQVQRECTPQGDAAIHASGVGDGELRSWMSHVPQ